MSLKYTCALFTIKSKSKLSMCMKHTLLSHKQKYTHVEIERNIPTAILPQSLPNLTPKGFFSKNKTNRGNTMETGHISGPRPFSQYHKDWWHEQSIANCSDSVRIELSEKLILSKIWNGYWKLKKYICQKIESKYHLSMKIPPVSFYNYQNITNEFLWNILPTTNGNYLSKQIPFKLAN